ncbi:ATP-binding protein [Streptomyces sp. 3213.3]|uniref:ATP-binding protein n=1 Tax=Streptomyces sp. 3213.3 TaxID=1855348 RepID=UPI000B839F4B
MHCRRVALRPLGGAAPRQLRADHVLAAPDRGNAAFRPRSARTRAGSRDALPAHRGHLRAACRAARRSGGARAVKHARADRLLIALDSDERAFSVTVRDNGRGMDQQASASVGRSALPTEVSTGTGLSAVRERGHLLNGHLDVGSARVGEPASRS